MTKSNWLHICHVTVVRRMRRSDVNIYLFYLYDKKFFFSIYKKEWNK
jgi:hypothetical protein